jgi:hypothetical protein
MAESWIRMRGSLVTNPKVIKMARVLLTDPEFLAWFANDGITLDPSHSVTRRHVSVVTRITVGALTPLWAMVNECAARDGILRDATLFEVDEMAGVPGFGRAMKAVGWLIELPDLDGVEFPNFIEHNTVKESRSTGAKTDAERAKEYRERKKNGGSSDVTNGVTKNCDASRDTVTTEKRREEKNKEEPPTGVSGGTPPNPGSTDSGKPSPQPVVLPDWLPKQPWDDFVAMRRAKGKRAPFTFAAAKGIVAELEKLRGQGQDPAGVLQQSTMNGWSGVFAVHSKGAGSGQPDWTEQAR